MSVDHIFKYGDHPEEQLLLARWTEYINQKEQEQKKYGGAAGPHIDP